MTRGQHAARWCYLAALALLQVMLAWHLVPVLAGLLTRHVPLGHASGGAAAVAEVGCAALSVLGTGVALAYPCIVLMRHVQRGAQRFCGLPPWAVAMTLAGSALLATHGFVQWLGPMRSNAMPLPLAAPGIALMSAGALLAELLRRSRPTRSRALALLGPTVRLHRVQLDTPSAADFDRAA